MADNGQVLHWSGRVFSAEDLRRSLNGHRELVLLPRTIVTPLAAEELRSRGIQVTRQEVTQKQSTRALWGYAQEKPHSFVQSAVKALERDGLALSELTPKEESSPCRWARAVAECVAVGECKGGVVFCQDPALLCCVANKLPGLRSAAASSVAQAARATLTLGANLLAVEMPGRTFFEVRQILRTLCAPGDPNCPPELAGTLQELDGHAHR